MAEWGQSGGGGNRVPNQRAGAQSLYSQLLPSADHLLRLLIAMESPLQDDTVSSSTTTVSSTSAPDNDGHAPGGGGEIQVNEVSTTCSDASAELLSLLGYR